MAGKRLTVREKAEKKRLKKELQKQGVIPLDKKRLNRKRFAKETQLEFSQEISMADLNDVLCLWRAISWMTAGHEQFPITPEQVGVWKVLKMAVELKRFYGEARQRIVPVTYGDEYDKVVNPILKM